ncbi:MAG: hypothetical protein IJS09_09225 [Treponema sp.]|nr:hypothetical protein [Treponema sp.]
MKKILCVLAVFSVLIIQSFAFGGPEFGIGSGYIFYGNKETRTRNSLLNSPGQMVLNTSAGYHFPLADPVRLYAGVEGAFDLRWDGGNHIYMFDYAALIGFQIYPGLAGLMFTVDYAFGHRSDWVSIGTTEGWEHSEWGNGFKIGIQYDFLHNVFSYSPVIGVSWRRMPRGDGADNILSVFLKLTIN